MATIGIVGAGHVGLIYAACLAKLGHEIRVVDINAVRIAQVARGEVWFHEPGLEELLQDAISHSQITASTVVETLRGSEFVFICVPTPSAPDGSLDNQPLTRAVTELRKLRGSEQPIIVVTKSTVAVGTNERLRDALGPGFRIVANPEFLAEGTAVEDFFKPSRIVIGAEDDESAAAVAGLYRALHAPIVITDPTSAELAKLASNAFLAAKVSFANVIARLGAALGADALAVSHILGSDPRIGASHLIPGLGFGGSCLPKDLSAIEQMARQLDIPTELFAAVKVINRAQRSFVVDALTAEFGSLTGRVIAVLGIAFKPGTDDVRESPGLLLATELSSLHAEVRAYDPLVGQGSRPPDGSIHFTSSAIQATRNADAVVIATAWSGFGGLDLTELRRNMSGRVIVDGRGVLDRGQAECLGFKYYDFRSSGRAGLRETRRPFATISLRASELPVPS